MKKVLILILILSFGLYGCGEKGKTKEELEQENAVMLEMLKENEVVINNLQNTIQTLTGSESGNFIQSINKGLTEINNKVMFPTQLTFNGIKEAPAEGRVIMTRNVSIYPSNNWVIKLSGSTAELGHSSGVYGTIKVGVLSEKINPQEINERVLKPFYSKFSKTSPIMSNIFVGDVNWGKQALINAEIEGRSAVVYAGFIGTGGTAVIYTFMYEGTIDKMKNELINTLIKSMKIGGMQVRFN